MELVEEVNIQYGIERDFEVPRVDDIEIYGFNSKYMKHGYLDSSPFVRKVETYLESIGVDYVKLEGNPAKSPRKNLPYMNYKGLCVAESCDIINYLRRNVRDLNKGIVFNKYQKTLMHMITTTLENSFYYCTLHQDHLHEEQWKQTRKKVSKGKGFAFTAVVPNLKKTAVKAVLDAQGYGRWPENEVIDRGLLDLQCIENSLEMHGESPFFMGDRVSIIDATIFAFLLPYFKMNPEHKKSRLYRYITSDAFPKLFTLCDTLYNTLIIERMREGGNEKQGTELMQEKKFEIMYEKKVVSPNYNVSTASPVNRSPPRENKTIVVEEKTEKTETISEKNYTN
jgi:glutathione S-transferase